MFLQRSLADRRTSLPLDEDSYVSQAELLELVRNIIIKTILGFFAWFDLGEGQLPSSWSHSRRYRCLIWIILQESTN